MTAYYRPLPRSDRPRPPKALPLAGGALWFDEAICHTRHEPARRVPLEEVPQIWRDRLSAARAPIAGLAMDRPQIMGILNVTPDSFSDGGRHDGVAQALAHARLMVSGGAALIDVGGESTRPGAETVSEADECARVIPAITAISQALTTPISIDTRKASVGAAALEAGAQVLNDVSGLLYDPKMAALAQHSQSPICIMHSQGEPETMQDAPRYDDVLLDIYDFLATQADYLVSLGVPRDQIIVDPGIGFGKTLDHNLALLNTLALFHGIGGPLLVGASRKGFLGIVTGAHPASARMPASVAVAMLAAQQGAQILRVHDVAETQQALTIMSAIQKGAVDDA